MGNLKMILPNCSYQFDHLVDIPFKCSSATAPSSSLLIGWDGLTYSISASLQLIALFHDGPVQG